MKKQRRYDIDWIRVLVFDILIIYHVGMFFVDWGWHIKNDQTVDWVQYPMLFINQWRIPILFVVSGMGTRFALSHRTGARYIKERFSRLFIPLLFGVLLIVPPQVYLERLTQGADFSSFVDFYPHYFEGIYPSGNFSWHHLWFLPYLLIMSIIATPIFLELRKAENGFIKQLNKMLLWNPFFLYLPVLFFTLIEYALSEHYPITHALVGDWYALLLYLSLFIVGYVLICCKDGFWSAVKKVKWIALIIGVLAFAWLQFGFQTSNPFLASFLKSLNMWSWILAIFAYSAQYLNKESAIIKYRNKAVYPFYILHQTITIICGYFLIDAPMHYSFKMLIMVAVTFGLSWFIYEYLILRVPFLQPLFGVKREQ